MSVTYLAYVPFDQEVHPFAHLMQRQLIVATARAVLSQPREKGSGPLGTQLMVSEDPVVLSLTSAVAADFTAFAEPEGETRHRPPVIAVQDQPKKDAKYRGAEDQPDMETWMHPGRFDEKLASQEEALREFSPSDIVVAGDPTRFMAAALQIADRWFAEFRPKLVYFPKFTLDEAELDPLSASGARLVNAEAVLRVPLDDELVETTSPFDTAFAEGESLDLEPFLSFGTAVEHAIWGNDLR